MNTKKYKLGVIGLGEGRSIISAALNSERWELVNICDLNEALCRERQQEFGLERYTTDYNELLNNPDIEVIGIYTPDPLHGLHTRQALKAGKHVICTKPLLPSLDEAAALLESENPQKRHVFVGQSSRFFEPMLQQRKDFENGRLGELVSVDAHYITDARWFLQKGWSLKRGFSWLHNFMIHPLDLVRWYLPDITEVYGGGVVSSNTRSYGLDCHDTMKFILKTADGRFATVGGSYASPTLNRDVEPTIACILRGTLGTTRGEYSKLSYNTHFEDEDYKNHTYDGKHSYYFRFEGESHHAGEYQNYIEYFAECLDNGITPLPDIKEGIQTLAILAAMERSLETGMPVKVGDILKERDLPDKIGK